MAPSPTIRRLLKETAELSPSSKTVNPTFHAAPLGEDNLYEWHFTLLGPPAPSPYAGGIYHGRITLPPAYPMKPPNFRFLTPSGRFEVNREICLSISGFHEETWQPAWGVRLALTALRGFMGEEGTAGQVGGLESSRQVRERLARESRAWRCGGCGNEAEEDGDKKGWTNEERMRWWWAVCREKGVDVEKEVEALEVLATGLKVEVRDLGSREEKGKQKEAADKENEGAAPVGGSLNVATGEVHRILTDESEDDNNNKNNTTLPNTTKPSTSQPLQGSHTRSPSTKSIEQRVQTPSAAATTSLQPPPLQHVRVQQQRPADSPISIDRAITVVFLALCLMILKKLFYPSNLGPLFGGYDDLRMARE